MMLKQFTSAAILLAASTSNAVADGSRQSATPLIPEGWEGIYQDYGFAPALQVGETIYVSGMIVRLMGEGTYEERYANGLRSLFGKLEKMIAPTGATLDDIVELTSFHIDLPRQLQTMVETRKALMNKPHPAWTAVGTTSLANPDGVTEIKFTIKLKKSAD